MAAAKERGMAISDLKQTLESTEEVKRGALEAAAEAGPPASSPPRHYHLSDPRSEWNAFGPC